MVRIVTRQEQKSSEQNNILAQHYIGFHSRKRSEAKGYLNWEIKGALRKRIRQGKFLASIQQGQNHFYSNEVTLLTKARLFLWNLLIFVDALRQYYLKTGSPVHSKKFST